MEIYNELPLDIKLIVTEQLTKLHHIDLLIEIKQKVPVTVLTNYFISGCNRRMYFVLYDRVPWNQKYFPIKQSNMN